MAPLTDRRGLLQALVKDGRPVFSARSAFISGSATPTLFTLRRQFWERRSSESVSR